jgi:hypothetical protein
VKLFGRCQDKNVSDSLCDDTHNIFIALTDTDKLNIYTHFIDDDYYYPYEAYANTSIAMFFGFILLILLLWIGRSCNVEISHSTYIFLCVFTTVYMFILGIVIYEARTTYKQCDDEEDKFISAYLSNKN